MNSTAPRRPLFKCYYSFCLLLFNPGPALNILLSLLGKFSFQGILNCWKLEQEVTLKPPTRLLT